MSDEVYYRILLDRDGELVVVTMQWFDELDYDQSRLSTERYDTQEAAESVVRRFNAWKRGVWLT